MNIAFRADASYKIGSGHVVRSLVLANELREHDHNIIFICRLLDGHLISLITHRGFEVITLGCDKEITGDSSNSDWLGVSQKKDAFDVIEKLKGRALDVLFVDHYCLDSRWETLLEPYLNSIVVIDDLADRNHNCDFLIDQNFRNGDIHCYDSLVPSKCEKLLGLQFAILSPEYRSMKASIPERTGVINRVLVYFGGTDWQDMTSLTLEVLAQDDFSFLEVDVVVGSNYPFVSSLKKLISTRPRTNFYQSLPSLASLMSIADIAIGGGGTTVWERMSMGLPALVVSLADNQLRSCEALQREGLIDYLGCYTDMSHEVLARHLKERIFTPDENYDLSKKISGYVDGRGVSRILQAMEL